jgi:tetratricopeptide (TPR) repeat protein
MKVAEANLKKALLLAPEYASAHMNFGAVLIHTNRALQGIAECERALELDRNLGTAHAMIGLGKSYIGRGEETEAHIKEALRLSPRETFAHMWIASAGLVKIYLGRDEDAVVLLRRAIEINQSFPLAHFFLAASLAHLNRVNDAERPPSHG